MSNPEIDSLLEAAKKATMDGDSQKAEQLFDDAIRQGEIAYGADNPVYGLILLDVLDFYDEQQNEIAAARMFNLVREIVLKNSGSEFEKRVKTRHFEKYR